MNWPPAAARRADASAPSPAAAANGSHDPAAAAESAFATVIVRTRVRRGTWSTSRRPYRDDLSLRGALSSRTTAAATRRRQNHVGINKDQDLTGGVRVQW